LKLSDKILRFFNIRIILYHWSPNVARIDDSNNTRPPVFGDANSKKSGSYMEISLTVIVKE